MLHARIARFDVMATVALFENFFGTKQALSADLVRFPMRGKRRPLV